MKKYESVMKSGATGTSVEAESLQEAQAKLERKMKRNGLNQIWIRDGKMIQEVKVYTREIKF